MTLASKICDFFQGCTYTSGKKTKTKNTTKRDLTTEGSKGQVTLSHQRFKNKWMAILIWDAQARPKRPKQIQKSGSFFF